MSWGPISGVRPPMKKIFSQRRLKRNRFDPTLGSRTQKDASALTPVTQGEASLVAPAIGAEVLIVARGLEAGSVILAGTYVEGTDYTITYASAATYLHNLAITPGTALDVIYIHPPDADGDGGGTVDLAPVEFPRSATLQNGWVPFGTPFASPGYYRDRDRCYLLGMIKNGTITPGTVLFDVDAGYEPTAALRALAAGSNAAVSIDVLANGNVVLGDSAFEVGTAWLSLDGISWRLATAYNFTSWGQTDVTFGSGDMDVPYEGLT